MREFNHCEWLIVGRTERCGKQCVNEYCRTHRAQLKRKPGSIPQPCRECGKGTKSETYLCSTACGSDRVKKTLYRVEVKTRRLHKVLMEELSLSASRQRECPFIGLR